MKQIIIMEQWKDIPNFEGYYQASDFGNIRSVDRIYLSKLNGGMKMTRKGIPLTPVKNHKGYFCVNLSKNGVSHYKGVHRWVAIAFLDNPQNLPEINHIDGVKTNNSVKNLEWCTSSYNTQHAYDLGLKSKKGEKNSYCKLTEQQVIEIRNFYQKNPKAKLKVFAEKLKVTEQLIYAIRSRRIWQHI